MGSPRLERIVVAVNVFGDSICGSSIVEDKFDWKIKYYGASVWSEVPDSVDATDNNSCDPRCLDIPTEISRDPKLERSFYYPAKKVPTHWLDKIAVCHDSWPPDSIWKLFLPTLAHPPNRKVKFYTKNLDGDAALEKILWCETDACSAVYCFDERSNDWFVVGIVGPDFLGNEPEFINNRPLIIIPGSIATSDHQGEHLRFYRLVAGHLKQVFDLWREEVLFPEGPGYTSKLYSTFRITNDTTIEVVYKFYFYGENQKRGNQKPTIRKTKHSKFTWDAKKQEFLPVTESDFPKDLQDFIRLYKSELPD